MKKGKQKPANILSGIFTLIILMLIIIFLSYYAYLNIPRTPQQLDISINPLQQETFTSDISQFYPKMKFNHNRITYKIDKKCNEEKKSKMKQAFIELSSNVPIITFFPSDNNPDIDITCSRDNGANIDEKHFIAGEGGAKEIIQTDRYNIINQGIILLYDNGKIKTKECDYPNVELHELLHVFGFDHSDEKNSIMSPLIESCNQILDKSYIEKLKSLYSEENLPDLYFNKIEATKKGRYLDFNLTIKNSGSIKSGDIILTILDGDSIIEKKELNNLDYGAGITLTTTNLKLKRLNPDKISFIIDKENIIREIDENNNIANVMLKE